MTMSELPSCGRIGPNGHEYPLRVHYADTDAGGVVYHANYLVMAERARCEMLRALDYRPTMLPAPDGIAFAVRTCTLDFRRPARLDDALTIVSRIKALGGASFDIEQRICQDDLDLVTILVRLVCIDGQFKPVRVPAELREALYRNPTMLDTGPEIPAVQVKA